LKKGQIHNTNTSMEYPESSSQKVKKTTPKKNLIIVKEDKEDKEDKDEMLIINNIKYLFEKTNLIQEKFKKCITGYHLLNASPINETMWEDLNSLIFSSVGIEVYSKSDGSHLSGMDIDCSLGKISNKSAKYATNQKSIDISSYRLTTVCSEKMCGTPSDIITEINRRKNFDYYSFIVRDESNKETIQYDWFFIPSNYIGLDPSSYTWEPAMGKRGKKIDTQIGWKTNEVGGCRMSITFSMSSQLWIHLEMTEDIKKYILATTQVTKKPLYNYIDLVDKLV